MKRVEMLGRLAIAVIREYAPDAEVHYDGADCDGSCLAEDLETALDALNALEEINRE